jgi:hypothetical protein
VSVMRLRMLTVFAYVEPWHHTGGTQKGREKKFVL